MAKDSKGITIQVGDLVDVTIRYRVSQVKEHAIYAAKVIGGPMEVVTIVAHDLNIEVVPEDFHFVAPGL